MSKVNYAKGRMYINQFDKEIQAQIMIELINALVKLDHVDDLQEYLNNALDSRLGDLIDIIDIEKYML